MSSVQNLSCHAVMFVELCGVECQLLIGVDQIGAVVISGEGTRYLTPVCVTYLCKT